MASSGVKIYPRPGLLRFMPFCGRVKVIKVIETTEDGRRYSLAKLRWLWVSCNIALHELSGVPDAELLDILSQLRGLRGSADVLNIQEVFGMCHLGGRAFVVASYFAQGRLLPYMKATPSLNRREYVLHAASGLEFLHAHGITHGDLSLINVFISDSGHAVLSGFPRCQEGPVLTAQPQVPYWQTVKDRLEPREAEDSDAPHEFLVEPMPNRIKRRPILQDDPVDGGIRLEVAADLRSTDAPGDIFAFGFLAIEIFAELGPTDCQSALRLLRMVKKGLRPPHPGSVSVLRGLDDLHWDVCLKCWSTRPEDRITSRELVERLRRADNIVRPAFEQSPDDLEAWVASRVPRLAKHITDAHDVREGRDTERGLYEVKGTLERDGSRVLVKIITPFIARRATLRRRHDFLTEAFIWSQLKHPNILPLLGSASYERTNNCFVVPWTAGSCCDYLRANPNASRLKILVQVADALQYLHSRAPTIVHGYVRARHVEVTVEGNALLASFDFQQLYNPDELWDDSWYDAESARWMPPELVLTNCTTKGDVFGFGMFAYEIYSGQLPMHNLPDHIDSITFAWAGGSLARGERPERPDNKTLTDDIWEIIQRCWLHSPILRPSMRTVAAQLRQITEAR